MKKTSLVLMLILPVLLLANSYEPSKNELESILSRFINYRFGTISVYKVKNIQDIRKAIRSKEEMESGSKVDDAILKTVDPEIISFIDRGVQAGDPLETIIQDIINAGKVPPERTILESVYNYYKNKGINIQTIENAYLITTRPVQGQIPNTIIAMIVTTIPGEDLQKNLRSVSTSSIYTYDEMKAFKLDTGFTSENMYDLMVNALIQKNIENKTLEAQGIGNPEWFAPKKFGKTQSLTTRESDINSYDIQNFMRISEGQPTEYGMKENEVIVSPDLLSWRRYSTPMFWNGSAMEIDTFSSSNYNLPKFGIELRYGIDEINYPSFWSERVTLSAIWESVKMGIILPTNGWSSLSKDLFGADRKLTYGGTGIAGSFDFPIKVIPQSGVFKFNFGYVFGDAKESSYKNRKIDPDNYDPNLAMKLNDFDYLVRLNAQLHYTFAVQVDNDYMMRFSIGGTIYNVERWYNDLDTSGIKNVVKFKKNDDETVGGISGRIEFMAKNIITPFGGGIQYFDEALSANIWLQIPLVEKTLALRMDARGFFSAFKDTPHDWELKSVFMPTARLIINF